MDQMRVYCYGRHVTFGLASFESFPLLFLESYLHIVVAIFSVTRQLLRIRGSVNFHNANFDMTKNKFYEAIIRWILQFP